MDGRIHIVLASDANYLPGLEVTHASIVRSCRTPERIVWHVFREDDLAKLDVSAFAAWNCGSKMTYLRLFLPDLLPDVDRALYTDVDTVWNRDVCGLWDDVVSRDSPAIWWVKDFRSIATHGNYGCAGVCVMNLAKLRDFRLPQKAIDYVRAHGTPPFVDQDILNILLKDDCAILPSVWNAMGDSSNLPKADEPCVYHLTGVGRHFHDRTPPIYPPQYLLWWREWTKEPVDIPVRYRALAALWSLHALASLLPLRLRERIVRQWFFAKVLVSVSTAFIGSQTNVLH